MIKNNIRKIFKKKSRQSEANLARYVSDAKHAWKIIIYVFAALNVGIMAFSGYLFFKINNEDIFKIKQDEIVIVDTIDRTLLHDTIMTFEAMEIEFEALKKKGPNVIDPSL